MPSSKTLGIAVIALAVLGIGGMRTYPYLVSQKVALEDGSVAEIVAGSAAAASVTDAKSAGFKQLTSSCRLEGQEPYYVHDVGLCTNGDAIVTLQKGSLFQKVLHLHAVNGRVTRIELVRTMDSL